MIAMVATAALVALATLAVGLALAYLLRLLPTVRLQLAGLAFLAVLLPLGAVLLSGWVMFHMGDDVKILAVIAASALTAVVAALVVARSIVASIDRVRDASVEHGSRRPRGARARRTARPRWRSSRRRSTRWATNLRRLFDTRRELVAWASHDLRTPLANMQAMLEALEDGLGEPEEYVPVLREQVQRAVAARRRPLRARAHRRGRAHARAAPPARRAGRLEHACGASRPRRGAGTSGSLPTSTRTSPHASRRTSSSAFS